MATYVPIEFLQAWEEAQRCVNARAVAAMRADDPVAAEWALK